MVRCPEGHESEATDYCDTCGAPIGAAPAGPVGPSAAAGAAGEARPEAGGSVLDLDEPVVQTQSCPHCGGVNVADALFCESCGYDFTTGALPLGAGPEEPEEAEEGPVVEPDAPEPDPDADPDTPEPDPVAPEPDPAADPHPPEPDPDTPEPVAEPVAPEPVAPEPEPEPEPQAPAAAPVTAPTPAEPGSAAHARPRHTPPSRDLADTWVVEVWVDPDWYAVQQTVEACPSAGVPDVVVVRRSVVMVGRPSGSLGVRPEVDAGADSAVSRRHAQLTSDGTRWWIEDLGSSNGTYVGVVGEPLPTQALTPGQRVEIDRDDRIYVGAWTRLVLRQATASERAGQG
ncbi:FHA domain-containing protein [uncultured Serinicoccus sp.]|uniref:FHA domain-containing protein n=1 Tax=uncultured Serinicoccus sp. TaxID=735514 RepID=UPI002601F636|nr:FHA domain-containing protein [uncultured Serinicoccus sp.]